MKSKICLHCSSGLQRPLERPRADVCSRKAPRARRDSLEDEVINVGQRCSDALEQQVQRLNGCCLLARALVAGAQRQTEVELQDKGALLATVFHRDRISALLTFRGEM